MKQHETTTFEFSSSLCIFRALDDNHPIKPINNSTSPGLSEAWCTSCLKVEASSAKIWMGTPTPIQRNKNSWPWRGTHFKRKLIIVQTIGFSTNGYPVSLFFFRGPVSLLGLWPFGSIAGSMPTMRHLLNIDHNVMTVTYPLITQKCKISSENAPNKNNNMNNPYELKNLYLKHLETKKNNKKNMMTYFFGVVIFPCHNPTKASPPWV